MLYKWTATADLARRAQSLVSSDLSDSAHLSGIVYVLVWSWQGFSTAGPSRNSRPMVVPANHRRQAWTGDGVQRTQRRRLHSPGGEHAERIRTTSLSRNAAERQHARALATLLPRDHCSIWPLQPHSGTRHHQQSTLIHAVSGAKHAVREHSPTATDIVMAFENCEHLATPAQEVPEIEEDEGHGLPWSGFGSRLERPVPDRCSRTPSRGRRRWRSQLREDDSAGRALDLCA